MSTMNGNGCKGGLGSSAMNEVVCEEAVGLENGRALVACGMGRIKETGAPPAEVAQQYVPVSRVGRGP
jgi:hypothetical protein